jgi:hypothetical protein
MTGQNLKAMQVQHFRLAEGNTGYRFGFLDV